MPRSRRPNVDPVATAAAVALNRARWDRLSPEERAAQIARAKAAQAAKRKARQAAAAEAAKAGDDAA